MALLDPLLQVAEALREIGVSVTTGRNRLRRGVPNLVFGAHLGFDPALAADHDCVFVNLEQLGAGGKPVATDYLRLLATHNVIDYNSANTAAYGRDAATVPLLTFGHSPRLAQEPVLPLRDREIDLLFLGALMPRRIEVLQRLHAIGVRVAVPSAPLYGPERDDLVRRSRAVLNVSAYETSRFEQVRASLCLSLGTPVVSERRPVLDPGDRVFLPHVSWFDVDRLEDWFSRTFPSADWERSAQQQVESFSAVRTTDSVAAAWRALCDRPAPRLTAPVAERRMVLTPGGADYRMGWLTISTSSDPVPDVLVRDWSELRGVTSVNTAGHGEVELGRAELVEVIGDVCEHALRAQLTAALALLGDGGRVDVVLALPKHLSLLERVQQEHWLTGSATHRLALTQVTPTGMPELEREGPELPQGSSVRAELVRVPCAAELVTAARTRLDDLGGLMTPAPGPTVLGAPPLAVLRSAR